LPASGPPTRGSGRARCCPPRTPGGRLVFQVFLDEADRVCAGPSGAPYGRQVIAGHLDDDLLDYLGGGDLLIFR
jgi:hypothetical protein